MLLAEVASGSLRVASASRVSLPFAKICSFRDTRTRNAHGVCVDDRGLGSGKSIIDSIRQPMRVLLAPFIASLAAAGIVCDYPFEIVFLQDATAGFEDDVVNIYHQVSDLMNAFTPYSAARFGLATFRDKPKDPYGLAESDYCINYTLPITSNFGDLYVAYSKVKAGGGGDREDNSLGAVLSVALSNNMGWSPAGSAPHGEDYVRIILLLTDAPPHESSEINQYNLPPHNGKEDSLNATKCATYWYPQTEQVVSALKSRNIFVIPAVLPEAPDTYEWWSNFSDALGQPSVFTLINPNSSNFGNLVHSALNEVGRVVCPQKP